MDAYKEKQFLVFELDNGKKVKYDLSKKCFIGKSGKIVKSISTDLSGYTIQDVIESFSDVNYRNFLKFLNKNFVNKKSARYYWQSHVGTRVKNIGTFLSRIADYSFFEQYFSAGITNIDPNFRQKIGDLPKGFLNYCKNNSIEISEENLMKYKINIDNIVLIDKLTEEEKFHTLDKNDLQELLLLRIRKSYDRKNERYSFVVEQYISTFSSTSTIFMHLCETYKYNKIRLLSYIDDLMTYEGISSPRDLLKELEDYNRMLSEMSPTRKYEKYPKYFLSMHTITVRNYNRLIKTQYSVKNFEERVNKDLEFKYKDYCFIYPDTPEDIKAEAVSQNNCVASYIQKVIDGICDIMFLRKKDDIDKSLVTIEIRDWKVVQAKARFNQEPGEEEQKAIEEFNKYLEKMKKNHLKKLAEKGMFENAMNNITTLTKKMTAKVS